MCKKTEGTRRFENTEGLLQRVIMNWVTDNALHEHIITAMNDEVKKIITAHKQVHIKIEISGFE